MENYLAGTIIVRYIYILPLLYCRAGVKPRDARVLGEHCSHEELDYSSKAGQMPRSDRMLV